MDTLTTNGVDDATMGITSIDHDVKMIIWDLDDTLWNGTLAEGHIEFIDERAELIKCLATRGIISSIASKNDYQAARDVLEQAGIWDYFVFPSISYQPKGKRVSQIIQKASLRPENVVFVDDNIINLQEVRFFNTGIMLLHPADLRPGISSHPRFAGKTDLGHKRLKQYQLLQRKTADQETSNLSNEDFLRSSGIQISFDFDVEANFDRVIDLISRANQLNYTKVRLRTKNDIDALKSALDAYGISAACISCRDRYGDYGIIGFYVLKRKTNERRLMHFVFSCRTMNMGIEQFVYQYLGKPEINVIPNVAYGLDRNTTIDWISISEPSRSAAHFTSQNKLLLVGGCELLQLSSYCSPNRTEFVNKIITYHNDEYKIRYDDPYFFISDRAALQRSEPMKRLASWTYQDTLLLDHSISEARTIILAMRASLRHLYLRSNDDIRVRMERSNIQLYLQKHSAWFKQNFTVFDMPTKERLALIQQSFEWVNQRSLPEATIFIMSAATHKSEGIEKARSGVYNHWCSQYCQNNAKFNFIDVDELVAKDQILEDQYLTPAGYRTLSMYIAKTLRAAPTRTW
jgi:FkbH-like protein